MTLKLEQKVKLFTAIIVAAGMIVSGTVYALDTRYWRLSDQKQFEQRQLKREAKRYELACEATKLAQDCSYFQYLKQELEDLND